MNQIDRFCAKRWHQPNNDPWKATQNKTKRKSWISLSCKMECLFPVSLHCFSLYKIELCKISEAPLTAFSVFSMSFRPRRGWTKSFSPELPTVLPLSLGFGPATRAAIVPANRSHRAGAGRHRRTRREHEDPVLSWHIRTPRPPAEREHLWRIWWVPVENTTHELI